MSGSFGSWLGLPGDHSTVASPVEAPEQQQPTYRYLLCDLLTDQPLCSLPLRGVTFGRRISVPADFNASLDCPDADAIRRAKLAHANAGRSIIYVYRDGALWGGFILWNAEPTQTAKGGVSLSVQGACVMSYPFRRKIRTDLVYVGVDQGVILADLWRKLQADRRGNIGVVALDEPTGILRDRTYLASDAQWYGDQMQELGEVRDGAEFCIDIYQDESGVRHKLLRIGYPQIGGLDPVATLTRVQGGGGRILSWSEPADATEGATSFQARGQSLAGEDGEQHPLMSDVFEATDLLDRGWPLLDRTDDFPNIHMLTNLNDHAAAQRDRYSGAQRTFNYTVDFASGTWSPSLVGSPVRLKLADQWHTPAQTVLVRPVGVKVTAADRDTPETVELIFEDGS